MARKRTGRKTTEAAVARAYAARIAADPIAVLRKECCWVPLLINGHDLAFACKWPEPNHLM
jgi:hypothetical protein